MRGPIISTERSKQTPVRSPTPPHSTAPEIIRVLYPSYGPLLNPNSWSLSQPQDF